MPGDVLQEGGGAEERIERPGSPEENHRPLGFGIFVENSSHCADHVRRKAVRPLDERYHSFLQRIQAAPWVARPGQPLLALNHGIDELGALSSQTIEQQRVKRDDARRPAGFAKLGAQAINFAPKLELVIRRVWKDREVVVSDRADLRTFGAQKVLLERGD